MEELKQKAIDAITETEGGFFLITYDKMGFSELIEGIGDNGAAYNASMLSKLICDAQKEYINWRVKELKK